MHNRIGAAYTPVIQAVIVDDLDDPTIILPFVVPVVSGLVAIDVIKGEAEVTLVSVVGFAVGQHFRIIDLARGRFYFGTILSINMNIVTVDTPFDFDFVADSEAIGSSTAMNVDGSVTPVTFVLRTGQPSIDSAADVTRMMMACTTNDAVDLSGFGDGPALVNGMYLKVVRANGDVMNIMNVKTNADLANMTFDFTIYAATNPAQGLNGFVSRMTFSGQEHLGVVIRLGAGDDVEIVVQDDLTDIVELSVLLEGHIVVTEA